MRPYQNSQTKFNVALPSLLSLRDLLDDCNYYSRLCFHQGLNYEALKQWLYTLYAVRREINTKLDKKKEKKPLQKMFDELSHTQKLFVTHNTKEGNATIINPMVFQRKWHIMDRIDRTLRDLADKKGMLVPDEKSVLSEMDES